MKLEQFAKEYGLNTRAVNGLYDLKKRADRGEYPHDSDPRVRRLFDNNIEKALIIAVVAHLEYWRDRDNPNVSRRLPMLWRCTRVGNKTIINIIEAVYKYLDDPNTPDNKEVVEIFPPEESKPTSVDPTVNYINGAVVEYAGNNGYGYRGRRIEYSDGYARIKFVDSFGDELVRENGKLLRGECAGHLKVEIWGNEFDLEIETASSTIIEMTNMDIRLLKKLNNFLNYALNDKLLQPKENNDRED